jgi:hypothetical protein
MNRRMRRLRYRQSPCPFVPRSSRCSTGSTPDG